MGFLSGLFGGGKSKYEDVKLPDYTEDKYYESAQSPLFKTGLGLLEGKPSPYYAPIGEMGGSQFEGMLGLLKRDVSKGIDEDLIRRGIGRGGIGATAKAKAIGDISTQMRYSDYERALQGRGNLLETGANIMSGVRGGALSREGMRNPFELQRTGLDMQKAGALDEFQAAQDAKMSGLIKGAIGLAAPFALPAIGGALGGLFGKSTIGSTIGGRAFKLGTPSSALGVR